MILKEIYIVHYSKLLKRKKSIESLFKNENVNLNFITKYDQENIDVLKNHEKQYVPNKEKYSKKVKLWKNNGIEFYELNSAEISCEMKHLEALNMLSMSNNELGLILEDDVIPTGDNFMSEINEIINTNTDWDVLFIGTGVGKKFINSKVSFIDKIFKKNFVSIKHPATNCAEAYLIKNDVAKKIYNHIEEFNMAWDWELAYTLKELNLKIKWYIPPIFFQGSISGDLKSSLR